MRRAEEKQRLRREAKALAASLPPDYCREADAAIAAHLLAMPVCRNAGTVFCFAGMAGEIDTRPVLEGLLAAGTGLCLPLCLGAGQMELRQVGDLSCLTPGAYGILEPPADSPRLSLDQVDLAVLPCLTCDCRGRRLGRGGGYYDRFLAVYRGGTVLLCRERMLRREIPMEPHDRSVPWVLTERGLYEDGVPAQR